MSISVRPESDSPAVACSPDREETIRDLLEARLKESRYLALRRIVCECSRDIVTLRGTLTTHHLKQLAQETAAAIEGVGQIINQIEVRSRSRSHR